MAAQNRYLKQIAIILSLLFTVSLAAQAPQELGTVDWLRSYDAAIKQSEKTGKPVFILFQEVPGCATCRNYGQNVMSEPLLVDAIENEFVPLAIFNNKGGQDKKILDLYGEPTWNNPVVRIVNQEGKDLINRIAGNYSIAGVVQGMQSALRAADRPSPEYLNLIAESQASQTETAYYSMYCFWSGEAAFGSTDGVLATEPGWMDGKEVVKIVYDPNEVHNKDLDKIAAKNQCKAIEHKDDYKIDKDPQYYLKQSKYSNLALSRIQKSRINSALKRGGNPDRYLSPTQLAYLNKLKTSKQYPKLYDQEIDIAWEQMAGGLD